MNDSMTSVADIPDDANDDLSGISPELVLVDPELARLARERQALPTTPALTRASTLRLVRQVDGTTGTEAPIVPRPSPSGVDLAVPPPVPDEPVTPAPAPGRETAPDATPPVASAAAPAPPVVFDPLGPEISPPLAEPVEPEPRPEPIVPATRIVEAEPARALEPPRREIPAPLADPVRPSRPEPPEAPEPPISQTMEVAVPVMPHPVARPTGAAPTRRAPPSRRKGRRGLALLVAVAAASLAVLGFLQLTGGSPDPANDGGGRSAVGTPPSAKATHPSKTRAVVKAKAAAKPAPKPKPKPKAKTRPSTPKTGTAGGAAKPGPSKPKAATPKPTQPKASRPTPTQKAAQPKPATSQAPKVSSGTRRSPAPSPSTPAPAAAPETRRFAWAPSPGATGYHVELFKGADRVLAQETKEPVLELGSTWRYDGKTMRFSPGTYRWYVWPVTKGGRATQAVVQATLTIP
jgi:hypothetical protein